MIITPDVIQALNTNYKREFQAAYTAANSKYKMIATVVKSSTKSNTYGWLGKYPKFREWIGPRVFNDLKAHSYVIENLPFESSVAIDRDDIEDDNLGTYAPLMQEMGYSAATYPDEMVFPLLKAGFETACYDGQNFFDTDHPVYENVDGSGAVETVSNMQVGTGEPWYLLNTTRPLKPIIFQERKPPDFVTHNDPRNSDHVFLNKEYRYGVDARSNVGFGFWQQAFGSQAPLNQDNFNAAYAAMMSLKADGGKPLGIMPNLLVTGPANRAAARKVLKATTIDGGDSNTNYDAVELEVCEWLA